MNLSKRVNYKMDELRDSEFSNDEKLVEFLESVGLREGIEFCYNDSQILISEDVDVDLLKGKSITRDFPNVTFDLQGNTMTARYLDTSSHLKSVVLPDSVYQLLVHYSQVGTS